MRASGQDPLVEMLARKAIGRQVRWPEAVIFRYDGETTGCVPRQPDICSSARQRASGGGDPWRAGRQRLRDELRFEGALRGVCACGRGIFVLCHRGADVGDPRPCALRLRLCSTTRPFYPVAHFARPPTAGTATAQVESTHSFGYASCGPIVGTVGLLSSVLTSVHELSHVAT